MDIQRFGTERLSVAQTVHVPKNANAIRIGIRYARVVWDENVRRRWAWVREQYAYDEVLDEAIISGANCR